MTQSSATSTYQPKITTYTLSPAGTATFSGSTLTFDLSAYQTSASLATTYLKLDGTNNMTGDINIFKTTTGTDVKIKLCDGSSGTTNTDGCAIIKTATTNDMWVQNYETANLNIYTAGSNINFYTNSTQQMTINNSGNVGIGTNNTPQYRLDVNGEARIYNNLTTTNFYIGKGSASSILNLWDIPGAAWQFQTSSSNLYINNGTIAGTLNTKITILANGNLGIGTASPSGKLHIYEATGTDTSSTTGTLIIQHSNPGGVSSITFPSVSGSATGDYAYVKYLENVVSTSYNYFGGSGTESGALILGCENDASTNGPDSVIINPAGNIALVPNGGYTYMSGNVGIGTASPTLALDIYTDSTTINQFIRIRANNTQSAGLKLDRNGITWSIINLGQEYALTSNNLRFVGSTTSALELTQSGNVGIGTSIPSSLLHVNGSSLYPVNDLLTLSTSLATYNADIKFINDANTNTIIGVSSTNSTTLNSSYPNNFFIHATCNIVLNANNNSVSSNPHLFISKNGNIGIGTSTNLNSNLTINGSITGTTITASANLQEGGVNLSSKYLGINSNALNASNLVGNPNINVSNITSTGSISGIGSNLSLINFNNLSNLPTGLITSNSASNIFLTQTNASSTYLTSATASTTYLTQASATSTYDTISARNSALGSYLPLSGGTMTGNSITFPNNLYDYKIMLWSPYYGFGIQASELKYLSAGSHNFYNNPSGTQTKVMSLDGSGNLTANGTITGTTITASGNLQEGGVNLSSKYLGITSNALNASNLVGNPNINVSNITSTGSILTNNFIYADATYLNNYSFENQNTSIFPPINNFTSSSNSYSNKNYGNGTYIISGSSTLGSCNAYLVFDNNSNVNANSWISSNLYASNNTIPANYFGTSNTIIKNINNNNYSISGEWIQLQYNNGFAANQLTLYGITSSNNYFPYNFAIVASFDNSNWQLLSQQSNIVLNTSGSNLITFNNNTSYDYYRLIINNTCNASNVLISEMQYSGTQNSTYINADNLNTIVYNTNIKQFPFSSNFIASTEATALLNEIYSSPTTPLKQTLTFTNIGIYTIYSSTSDNTNFKSKLFDYNTLITNFGSWSASQYTTGTGLYSGTNYIGINNSKSSLIKGDWVIIKFPTNIILTSYIIYQNSTIANSPLTWNCFGSKDGITFIEITDASQTTNATYNNSSFTKIINNLQYPYLYIAWVFTKINGGTQLQISELSIFGKDDVATSIINNLNYDTSIKLFPPRLYDSSTTIVTNTNELSNIVPSPYNKETLTLNNQGTYNIYTSSVISGNINGTYLFDFTTNTILNCIAFSIGTANDRYNKATGIFNYPTYSSYISNINYQGDWIIIKFPFSIILTSFSFYQRTDIPERSPGKWNCYGSINGINWTLINEASNNTSLPTYTSYIYTQTLNTTFTTPYLYIGWVFNATNGIGSSQYSYMINFAEMKIYGYDYISNTPLNTWVKNVNNTYTAINSNNYVGIGTTLPYSKLHIYEATGTDTSSTTGTLIIQHSNAGGVSSITFPSVNGSATGDYAYIKYLENVVSTSYNYFTGSGTESGALILGCENDASTSGPDSVIINPAGNIALVPKNAITYISGNVGIGITNPISIFHISGTNPVLTISGQGGTGAISQIDLSSYNPKGTGTSAPFNSTCSLVATDDGNYSSKFEIKQKINGAVNAAQQTNLTILANGNVGVSITNPGNILQVGSGGRLRISNGNTDYSIIGTQDVDGTNNTRIVISGNTRSSGNAGNIEYISTTGNHIWSTSSTSEKMRITNAGNVGIGITNPSLSYALTVNSNLYVIGTIYSTGDIAAFYSDDRLKTKLGNITNSLNIINNLSGFKFRANEIANSYGINNDNIEIGLSAQEIQKVLPEIVSIAPFDREEVDGKTISKSGKNFLTVKYDKLIPVLIESIKELTEKINNISENFENRIKNIENKLK